MARGALEPGGYPPKHKLQPVKGADGLWRLPEVRHRSYSGQYVRTSGIGATRDECLADWDVKFERNRFKGSVRRKRRSAAPEQFERTDKMSAVFRQYVETQRKRVEKGEIKQSSYDQYYCAIYPSTGPRAKEDAIKLDSELGAFSIAEMGRPAELALYIEDIAELAPGMAVRHHTILTACFKALTLQGLYDDSPMRIVPRPDLRGGGQRALSASEREEFGKLLADAARTPRDHDYLLAFGLTLLGSGLRPGEALALRWSDIPELDDDTVPAATAHVCGTMVKLVGKAPYRQESRKAGERSAYYLTFPGWLTAELRAWKRVCAPTRESELLFTLKGAPMSCDNASYGLKCVRAGSGLSWLTWGNLRDTVATEVRGRTGDHKRVSAQLGHSEGTSMAIRHYIDPQGYKREAVDNSEVLDGLNPQNDGNLTIPARFPTGLSL